MAIDQGRIDRIVALAKEYGATRLILFGSAAEQSSLKIRDIDLACDGIPGWKIYELAARLEEELETSLDIVPLIPSTKFTQYIEKRGRALI